VLTIVVGAGPNGLAAAIELARAGHRVRVYERADRVGGGTQSAALTLPGFVHDVCSAVHPMGVASPFFRRLPLRAHGLEWIEPPAAVAHPFDDGTAAVLERSLDATVATLDVADHAAYRRLMAPFVEDWEALFADALAPPHVPRHPVLLARFGLRALWPAATLIRACFAGERARALFAGIAAHTLEPLTRVPTAAFGMILAIAGHAVGWPIARGGSQRIADALASLLRAHGGEIVTRAPVRALSELPRAAAYLLDLTPRQVLRVAEDRLPPAYRTRLARYRYGPGVFKMDWALSAPIPWTAAACARAGTVHVGGSSAEIAAASAAAWEGRVPSVPFVLVAQPSRFDDRRAPPGRHVAWAYCHVPHGSTVDMTDAIERQIERFAPGFRGTILARHTMTPVELERHDPNLVGGDINGGVQDLWQLFTRPVASLVPYRTPARGVYLCSASTPPGGAVHGLCGYHAAGTALRDLDRAPRRLTRAVTPSSPRRPAASHR
jgi:phytoene dehydrogenase-like protein